MLDCDVFAEADGGTRTASITGAYVPWLFLSPGRRSAIISAKANPLISSGVMISVGIIDGTPCLTLPLSTPRTCAQRPT